MLCKEIPVHFVLDGRRLRVIAKADTQSLGKIVSLREWGNTLPIQGESVAGTPRTKNQTLEKNTKHQTPRSKTGCGRRAGGNVKAKF
jgi:hypothetical protein